MVSHRRYAFWRDKELNLRSGLDTQRYVKVLREASPTAQSTGEEARVEHAHVQRAFRGRGVAKNSIRCREGHAFSQPETDATDLGQMLLL